MDAPNSDETYSEVLERVIEHLEQGSQDVLADYLHDSHPAEVADLLESLPPEQRIELWETLPTEQTGEILRHLHDEARASIIDEMDHQALVAAAQSMAPEDLADVVEELPDERYAALLETLDQDHRRRVETVLTYDEDTAGRLMSTDVISVRDDVTLSVVLRWLRRHESLPPHTDAMMVITESGAYLGRVSIDRLLTQSSETMVKDVMDDGGGVARANMSAHEVAALFERRDLISLAVLDDHDHLLGRITVDDVIDVILEESDRALLNRAGLDEEEDLFAPVLPSAKRRGLWLGLNLLTVLLASTVISNFEAVLDKVVALAILLPIVASMGGIAGSQTLTLTIRGIALDQIANTNVRWLITKEVAVGAVNGLAWAMVVAVIAYFWFRSSAIAVTIGAAMILNLIAASLAGVVIPLLLKRVGLDPALSGAVLLTTVTDIIGFLSFLGLASLILL